MPKRSVSIPYSGAEGAGASGRRIAVASTARLFHRFVISLASLPCSVM
jgi:hypothetical protein